MKNFFQRIFGKKKPEPVAAPVVVAVPVVTPTTGHTISRVPRVEYQPAPKTVRPYSAPAKTVTAPSAYSKRSNPTYESSPAPVYEAPSVSDYEPYRSSCSPSSDSSSYSSSSSDSSCSSSSSSSDSGGSCGGCD